MKEKGISYPELMKEDGEFQPVRNLGLRYKDFIEPFYEIIKKNFDEGTNTTDMIGEEGVLRTEFNVGRFPLLKSKLVSFFEQVTGKTCTELTITRMPEVDKERVSKEDYKQNEWISELWHSDNFRDGHFKIFVYCNEVTEDNAPTELAKPMVFFKYGDVNLMDTRFDVDGEGEKFTCEAFTSLIFNPNCLHKGNYSKKGYRDAIMLGFEQ